MMSAGVSEAGVVYCGPPQPKGGPMAEMAGYRDVMTEIERLLRGARTDMSSVLRGDVPDAYFLLPQGGIVEFVRFGRFGLNTGDEEALLRVYDLDGTCIASFVKGFEPWHVFAMKLPTALFGVELHALSRRPSFLPVPNWAPCSLADRMAKASERS